MSIDELFAAWKHAIANGDAAAAAALVAEDAEFWSHGAPTLTGRAAVQLLLAGFFTSYTLVQEFEELERIVAGDLAFIRGIEHNTLTPRPTGEPAHIDQRAFMLLRRNREGTWQFARGMTNLATAPRSAGVLAG